ncbi:hypothetical protein [Lysobacter sp. Root690]|uniref:hypothetical protein n=1 Tax=Lysobacter sp. Root690 TaxID=1736588 RepID=UPI000701985A|nr:hypothetical protein [Lysobacter sp. Root690]KRB05020.1 hypothetical protein ASD86_16175 [Lysobacter sp. Root690]
MRRSTPTVLALLVAALLPLSSVAMRLTAQSFVCPIDGQTFSTRLMSSGTSFGSYFDTQRFGAIASPAPLPVCPGNGFIVVDEKRSYSDAELVKLRAFVASDEYRGWVANDTPYYRLAKQMVWSGESPERIAGVLLQATWEAGSQRYPRYAAEALEAMQQRAAGEAGSDRVYHTRMLIGELQRRLGRFDQAQATFEALRRDPAFPGKQEADTAVYMRKVLDAQLQLVRARSVAHARLDEDGTIVDF